MSVLTDIEKALIAELDFPLRCDWGHPDQLADGRADPCELTAAWAFSYHVCPGCEGAPGNGHGNAALCHQHYTGMVRELMKAITVLRARGITLRIRCGHTVRGIEDLIWNIQRLEGTKR